VSSPVCNIRGGAVGTSCFASPRRAFEKTNRDLPKRLLGGGWAARLGSRGRRGPTIFRILSNKGRDPASCHERLPEHRSPTQLETKIMERSNSLTLDFKCNLMHATPDHQICKILHTGTQWGVSFQAKPRLRQST